MTQATAAGSPFRQPRAVWAVAFACVISFTPSPSPAPTSGGR
ncbi:hypothetical protein [Nonomuraea sp. B5E05]